MKRKTDTGTQQARKKACKKCVNTQLDNITKSLEQANLRNYISGSAETKKEKEKNVSSALIPYPIKFQGFKPIEKLIQKPVNLSNRQPVFQFTGSSQQQVIDKLVQENRELKFRLSNCEEQIKQLKDNIDTKVKLLMEAKMNQIEQDLLYQKPKTNYFA
jgi:hypothetical protein